MNSKKLIKRYLRTDLRKDLEEKMVFIGGPRQVGKTTLALQFLNPISKSNPAYLNWDLSAHREKIRKEIIPHDQALIVFDEIHKYKRWRRLVKGLFDVNFPKSNFIVTGSAKLDHYRKGGDSLQGRYHYWRLHPFSVGELGAKALDDLLEYGGFPEPFLKSNRRSWRRWSRERLDRIVREDISSLERIVELSLLELLIDALPERIGSPLSLNSLAEDLEVSPRTVDRWITILESLYQCFRVAPFGAPKIRAVKKAKKLYLWDWAEVPEKGARFENLVASHLLKYCHYTQDSEGHRMELRYLKDTDGREIDFVVLKDRKAVFAVECKYDEKQLSPAIKYFKERTAIPAFYQVHLGKKDFGRADKAGRVLPFGSFCREMELP